MTQKRRRCPDCGGSFTGRHPEMGVTSEYGVHAHVDVGIARLVAACWAAAIPTDGSCQGGEDEAAHLGFPAGFAERFARIITSTDRPEVLEATDFGELDWRIYTAGEEAGCWTWIPGYPWSPGFSVSFPSSDIPELTRRLESYLEAYR